MAGKENPESGLIEEPVFIRGFDPASYKWTAPPKPSPWKRHFELGRANPGKWMKVSEVKKGGCRARLEGDPAATGREDPPVSRSASARARAMDAAAGHGSGCPGCDHASSTCAMTAR